MNVSISTRHYALALTALLLCSSAVHAQCWTDSVSIPMPNPEGGAFFGWSVSVSGHTAVVGAPGDNTNSGKGSVFFFDRNEGGLNAWGKVKKRIGSWPVPQASRLGESVALTGDTVIAGAPEYDGPSGINMGLAYVYERDYGGPNAWGEAAQVTASDASAGDRFGNSVAIDGETAVVGAWLDDVATGAAYVYERDHGGPNAWGEVTKLLASDGAQLHYFGTSVAIHGDTIAVGASGVSGARGAAYVFERDLGGPNAWGESAKLTGSGIGSGDQLGTSVSISGHTIAAGAPFEDHSLNGDDGTVYLFERDLGGPGAWGEAAAVTVPGSNKLGRFTSLDGDRLVSGDDRAHLFERDLGGPGNWGLRTEVVPEGYAGGGFVSGGVFGATVLLGDPDNVAYAVDEACPPTGYCTAGVSGSGCQALLQTAGNPSASLPSGYWLAAENVEGNSAGLFFYGTNGRQAAPWGNGTGYQCVAPPVRRGGLLPAVGATGVCNGSFLQDLNARWCPACPKPGHNPGAGAVMQAQLWYRDRLSTSNQTTNFSDAVEFVLVP